MEPSCPVIGLARSLGQFAPQSKDAFTPADYIHMKRRAAGAAALADLI